MDSTVNQMLAACVAGGPDLVAVEEADTGRSLTYAELEQRAETAAAELRRLGLSRGDSLAVWIPNGIEWLGLFFGAARLGVLVVPLNTRYRAPEVRHLLAVSGARVLVVRPDFHGIDFAAMAAEAVEGESSVQKVVLLGDDARAADLLRRVGAHVSTLPDLGADGADGETADRGRPEDPVVVFGTSGTTSFPKLAAHHQAGAVRHVANVARSMRLGPGDRVLTLLPFCGTYGFIALMATLSSGATAVVLPVIEQERVEAIMDSHAITCFFGVEANLRLLLARELAGERPDRYRAWVKGGIAGINVRDVIDLADELGTTLVNLYGSSELFAMMATWELDDDAATRALAGGRILEPDMHSRAVDPATRAPLPVGESGELEFSGFHVTHGYLANAEANERAFTDDGWYRSGDRGRLVADRVVEYQSRLSDALRLRGYLVSPAEIEELLVAHPGVVRAEVVGAPDAATGEDVAFAFVIVTSGTSIDALREWCRERAAAWKVPAHFVEVTDYPVTSGANGDKVQKGKLRDRAVELLASAHHPTADTSSALPTV